MNRYTLIMCLLSVFWVHAQGNKQKAFELYEHKKYVEAKPYFEALLKESPNDAVLVEHLADVYAMMHDYEGALNLYKRLTKVKSEDPVFLYRYAGCMAMIAKKSNKFKALSLLKDIKINFEKSATLDPKYIDVRWALVLMNLEVPSIFGGSEVKAKQYAEELLAISKVDGYLAKGDIEVNYKRYDNAEGFYKSAYKIGRSKVTFQKLYDLYLKQLNAPEKAKELKEDFSS